MTLNGLYDYDYAVAPSHKMQAVQELGFQRRGPEIAYGTVVTTQGVLASLTALTLSRIASTEIFDMGAASSPTSVKILLPGTYKITLQVPVTLKDSTFNAEIDIYESGLGTTKLNTAPAIATGTANTEIVLLTAVALLNTQEPVAADPAVINFRSTQKQNGVGFWMIEYLGKMEAL